MPLAAAASSCSWSRDKFFRPASPLPRSPPEPAATPQQAHLRRSSPAMLPHSAVFCRRNPSVLNGFEPQVAVISTSSFGLRLAYNKWIVYFRAGVSLEDKLRGGIPNSDGSGACVHSPHCGHVFVLVDDCQGARGLKAATVYLFSSHRGRGQLSQNLRYLNRRHERAGRRAWMNKRLIRFYLYLAGEMVGAVLHSRGNFGTNGETLPVRWSIAIVKFRRTRRQAKARGRDNQTPSSDSHGVPYSKFVPHA